MKNYLSEGSIVTRIAPLGGVVSGVPFVLGAEFLVPVTSADAGLDVACVKEGKVRLTAKTGDTFTPGCKAYFNPSTVKIEATDSASNYLVGTAEGAQTAAHEVDIVLNGGSLASADGDLEAKANKTDLASTANGEGASLIGIEDPDDYIDATDVEGALVETAEALDDLASSVENYLKPIIADWDPTDIGAGAVNPPTANEGDRYVANATQAPYTVQRVYEYDGAVWVEYTASAGDVAYRIDEAGLFTFDGGSWNVVGSGGPVAAEDVSYDNGESGIPATNVQDAIDGVIEGVRPRLELIGRPVLGNWNPSGGLPVAPVVGNRYLATDSGNGWTSGHIYECTAEVVVDPPSPAEWQNTSPVKGMFFLNHLGMGPAQMYQYDGSDWAPVAYDDSNIIQMVDDLDESVENRIALPVIGEFDNMVALPVGGTVGDRYLANATANGWNQFSIYELTDDDPVDVWTETVPVEGMQVYAAQYDGPRGSRELLYWTGTEWASVDTYMASATLCGPQNGTGVASVEGTVVSIKGITSGGARAADLSGWYIEGIGDLNSDGGVLYGDLVDDTGGLFHLDLFSDSGKFQKVAHTASVDPDGTTPAALVEDNTSGIAGKVILVNAPTAGVFTVEVPLELTYEAAPSGTRASSILGVVLDSGTPAGEGAGVMMGGQFFDGDNFTTVLVKTGDDVTIGDVLTLSATVAGMTEPNGIGAVIGIAVESKMGTGASNLVKALIKIGPNDLGA